MPRRSALTGESKGPESIYQLQWTKLSTSELRIFSGSILCFFQFVLSACDACCHIGRNSTWINTNFLSELFSKPHLHARLYYFIVFDCSNQLCSKKTFLMFRNVYILSFLHFSFLLESTYNLMSLVEFFEAVKHFFHFQKCPEASRSVANCFWIALKNRRLSVNC